MIHSLKLRNMHAECKFEVMTYISISKPAGHAGKATKMNLCPYGLRFLVWESPLRYSSLIVPVKSLQHENWTQTSLILHDSYINSAIKGSQT